MSKKKARKIDTDKAETLEQPSADEATVEAAATPARDLTIDDVQPAAPAPVMPAARPKREKGTTNRRSTTDVHPCGLPNLLVYDKDQLLNYTKLHEVTLKELNAVHVTSDELALYDQYKNEIGLRSVTSRRFAAALRLFRNNYPLQPTQRPNINELTS